jgi:hypothetical protein
MIDFSFEKHKNFPFNPINMVYFNSGIRSSDYMSNDRMIFLRYCPGICLEGLKKTTKTSAGIAGLWAKI